MSSLLIGKSAPHFKAKAVIGGKIIEEFSLSDFLGKYVVFFFYPLDFTFVCPTELHAFQEKLSEFQRRGAQVIGCSVDSWYTHAAWMAQPKREGGIQGVEYPIVSDLSKSIAKSFHVLKEDDGIAYRGQFLIDKEGIIRHQLVNDLPLGRSVDEVVRLLDALIFTEKHGEVCPANWQTGERSMTPDQKGLNDYFTAASEK